MALIEARDHTELFVKDWGTGRPVILIHGYPLNADSFDRTAMKLVDAGHRVISYDRRGFGRSGQPWQGFAVESARQCNGWKDIPLGYRFRHAGGWSQGTQ